MKKGERKAILPIVAIIIGATPTTIVLNSIGLLANAITPFQLWQQQQQQQFQPQRGGSNNDQIKINNYFNSGNNKDNKNNSINKNLNLLTKSDLVRRYLLSPTLEHAVSNSKYYKDKIGNDLAKKVSSLSDIRSISILFRETFVRQQEQIRCIKEFPDYLVHTSGMTGEQISVPIYKREIEAYRNLVLEQIKLPFPLPLTLSIMDSSNTTKACLKLLPAIDAAINNRTEHIVKILQKKYNYHNSVDSSITMIQASLLSMRRLTMLAA